MFRYNAHNCDRQTAMPHDNYATTLKTSKMTTILLHRHFKQQMTCSGKYLRAQKSVSSSVSTLCTMSNAAFNSYTDNNLYTVNVHAQQHCLNQSVSSVNKMHINPYFVTVKRTCHTQTQLNKALAQ